MFNLIKRNQNEEKNVVTVEVFNYRTPPAPCKQRTIHLNPDGTEVRIPIDTQVGHNVTIGKWVSIGSDATIGDNCRIGDHVTIGDRCVVNSNATISSCTTIGEKCTIGARCLIGQDGEKCNIVNTKIGDGTVIEKWCNVVDSLIGHSGHICHSCSIKSSIVGNNVSLGAHCTIEPRVDIGDNVALSTDSLLQQGSCLGNGVKVGENCMTLAQENVSDYETIERQRRKLYAVGY